MDRPIHFEIPVDDPSRAEAFYGDAFGWTVQSFPGAPEYYGLATTGEDQPGINGALFQRRPGSGTTLTMGVASIEEAAERVTRSGGRVVQEKAAVPGVGWFALCEDTEGNVIGIFTDDPSAA